MARPENNRVSGNYDRAGTPLFAPVPGCAPRPTIVTLCGSTRFKDEFAAANFRETLAGKIVLSIGCDAKTDQELGITDKVKVKLDELHKRKIDLSDEILVLNVGGYIGKSTRSEIDYAIAHGKRVRWLETQEPNAELSRARGAEDKQIG